MSSAKTVAILSRGGWVNFIPYVDDATVSNNPQLSSLSTFENK